MKNIRHFPLRRKNLKSRFVGALHWLKNLFQKRHDVKFLMSNVSTSYWVSSNTHFSKHLTKYKSYEAENSNWILDNFYKKDKLFFVDVGANFGWYSLIFSNCAGPSGLVISIEPEPQNLRLLRKNILENNIENVSIIPVGVGSAQGFAELTLNDHWNPGMHSLRNDIKSHEKIEIEIKTLDSILSNYSGVIDLLKIDIEGFEVDALMGASETLARTKHVLVEYTPKFIRACGRDPEQLLAIFESHNFLPHLMENGHLKPCNSNLSETINKKIINKKSPQLDIFYIKS